MSNCQNLVIETAANIFSVPVENLNVNTSVGSIPEWDSMAHMSLISALEEKFKIEFDMDELFDVETLGDLIELIENGH